MLIALCTDEKYAIPCAACITSIFETNATVSLEVAILANHLKAKTAAKFEQIAQKYNRTISIRDIHEGTFKNLTTSKRFPEANYYRLLLPDLFPQHNTILYLDCDTIVADSLTDLFETDINGYACACVEDQASDDIRHHNRIGVKTTYFNAGVMLINANYWRENHVGAQCIDFIQRNPAKCLYPDQDALNVVLSGTVKYLPYRWNFQELMMCNDPRRLMLAKEKWADIDRAKKNPVIIHYTSSIKPWHIGCKHPLVHKFWDTIKLTPWPNHKPQWNKLPKVIFDYLKQFARKSGDPSTPPPL